MKSETIRCLSPSSLLGLLGGDFAGQSDTLVVTSYLKGLAIAAVVALHYTGALFTDKVSGSANLVVSVFFLLSGYGIFYSLENRVRRQRATGRMLLGFYASRAVRVLPLLWVALLLDSLTSGRVYTPADFSGNPVFPIPFIYWFVSYVIQCYIAAPVLWVLLKRVGWRRYSVLVLAFLAVTYAISVTSLDRFAVYEYAHLSLGHLILFSFGMAIPTIVSDRKAFRTDKYTTPMFFVFFVLLLVFSLPAVAPWSSLPVYLAPLFLVSVSAFCLSAIGGNRCLPLSGIIALVGTYSYSVYLFHLIFYFALQRAGIAERESFASIILIVLLLPIFFFVCLVAEKASTSACDRLMAWTGRVFRRLTEVT
ncbi:MAG: acyltransferase family protein [Dehalococcoidia bacterium]|nr:acyltransferase family protein [Dehalococcoidia bacterium]